MDLLRLALAYERTGADIARLFSAPSVETWAQICRRRQAVEPDGDMSAAEAERLDACLRQPPASLVPASRR